MAMLLRLAVVCSFLVAHAPARAVEAPSPLAPAGTPMTMAEFQGLSCAALGAATGLAALAYLDPITVAAAGTFSTPLLLIPVVAAGFAVGCSVGATVSPALAWAYRQGW